MPNKKDENAVAVQGEVVGFVQTNNKNIQKFQEKCNQTLMNVFNNEGLVRRFISSVMLCCARNPKLNDCTPESFRNVLLACAEFKLFPSTVTGQCFIVPFKNKGVLEASFMLGYQGMITLAERAGVQIDAQIAYANDDVTVQLGTNPTIEHKADFFSSDRGDPIGAYAIATPQSGKVRVLPMSMEAIYKHRAKSKSWQSEKGQKYSPWHPDNDPQLTMPKKTAIRQIFKFIPKDDLTDNTISKALELDAQSQYTKREIDVTPTNPTAMDIQAFVQEAREHLASVGKDAGIIEDALKEVTGSDSFNGITTDQLAAVKALIFTGEAPSGDEKQGELL